MEPEILKVARAVLAAYDSGGAFDVREHGKAASALADRVLSIADVDPFAPEAGDTDAEIRTAAPALAHAVLSLTAALAEALLRPDETAALRRLLAEAREAVVTCLDVWPDGAVGQKCADLLARIDAATKGGGK